MNIRAQDDKIGGGYVNGGALFRPSSTKISLIFVFSRNFFCKI